MINITLHKAKYRRSGKILHRSGIDPAEGTPTYTSENHSYKGRTGNCHGPTPKRSKSPFGKGPRRRSYGPF